MQFKFMLINDGKEYAFVGLDDILSTEITIPKTFNGIQVTEIRYQPFFNCSSLKKIVIPANIKEIGTSVFTGCSSLMNIDVDPDSHNYSSIEGVLYNKKQTELIACPQAKDVSAIAIPHTVIKFASNSFNGCLNLKLMKIPNTIIEIGHGAFSSCKSLISITIPESVAAIDSWVFQNCISLKTIEVSKLNPNYLSIDGVLYNKDKTILIAFPGCKNGDHFTIPNTVVTIAHAAFDSCAFVTSIEIPDGVIQIGNRAFHRCASLKSLTIPDTVLTIVPYAITECPKLTIYASAIKKPVGWRFPWTDLDIPVIWNYTKFN